MMTTILPIYAVPVVGAPMERHFERDATGREASRSTSGPAGEVPAIDAEFETRFVNG